jgi:predicted molibdopterin-dependent oxidoreductase YjgC
VQRIGRAFPPLADAREDWRFLLELAGKLGLSIDWRGPQEIFDGLAGELAPFEGLSYERIGAHGADVATATEGAAAE